MKTIITGIFTFCCIVFASSQIVSKTIALNAGGLSTSLTANELSTVTNLNVTGIIDARDFKTMRDAMPVLSAINLSGAKIVAYSGTDATGGISYPDHPENGIPQFAFFNSTTKVSKTTLKIIVLPSTLLSVERSSFYGCTGIDSISLPLSATSIKRSAFNSCSNLQKINIPSGTSKLDDYCFAACTKLTTLNLPSTLTTIGACAFLRSGISNISLPSSLNYIGDYAFQNCSSLGTINIPASVNFIGYCAFTWVNSLKSINVDSNNPIFSSVDGVLFDKAQKNLIAYPNAKSANYQIPSGVTAIDTAAFEGSTVIENVYVPASVTKFSLESFYYCVNLKSIEIPAVVTKIEPYSFYNCYQLNSIYSKSSSPVAINNGDSIFNYINTSTCKLYVPVGSKSSYQSASVWSKFSNIVEFLTYNVTVPAETKVCYIAGEMNGWTQQAMTKIDNTHYSINIPGATTSMQYKYCSGPGWVYVENTANGNNRPYTANDIVTSWSQVYDPSVIPVDVTYNVTVPTGTFTCYFVGGSTNWAHQEMIKVDATHFRITVNTATPNAYKYCSGPDWKYEELDASGQSIADRDYQTSDVVIQWKEIYIPASAGTSYNVTVPSGTKACYIAGEMNSWTQQPMIKVDDTHYKLTIVGATTAQKYKYCSGPDWSYEELNADNTKVPDRTHSAADVVTKWTAIWNPDNTTVIQISNTLTLSSGTVTRYVFNSTNIGSRTVDVWLPASYSSTKKYAVLYMHDGQMLFDATQTWNGQEWKVDETVTQLMQNSLIKDIIVVGIWNGSNRYSEYYPKKSMDYLPTDVKNSLMTNVANDPKGDKYLSFITSELKPYIDKTYSVNTDISNTYIAGSSMGGLISWYAMCEYPDIFGGAICMSTHWADNSVDSPEIPNSFRKYLLAKIPSPLTHKIYFDHGTVDLDANYAIHQVSVDTIMKFKGYTAGNFESLIFTGDGHNESAWSNRLNVPLKFILKNNLVISGLDMAKINNKIEVLNTHIRYLYSGIYTNYNYQFKQLTAQEYQAQKPVDNLSFDAGFVDSNGIINITEPTTTDQKAVFANLTTVALYYLCQSYIYNFYQTKSLPLLLKVGFGMYEAGLLPSDTDIKTIINGYGGTISSFDVLNNSSTFISNKGYLLSGVFGEFMNVYKNWGYQYITQPTSDGFNVDPNWFNATSKQELLADFNRYLNARFLEPTENLRLKVCYETEHLKFYTTQQVVAINFPLLGDSLESTFNEYSKCYSTKAFEKISVTTLAGCTDALIEGISCDPNNVNIGGTAWSSGLHFGCTLLPEKVNSVIQLGRHELAHVFLGLFHQGIVTAWLNEGFPSFSERIPVTDENISSSVWKQQAINALNAATQYFGHRPTYEDTKVYPTTTYWDYYHLGVILNYYIYQKGNGYTDVKDVQINDLATYNKMGYPTRQAFLDDFYFFFDAKIQGMPVVTLLNPKTDVTLTSSSVAINWTPLKADTKLNVAVSTDNKNRWTTLATGTTQTYCNWNAETFTGPFYLRFSAPDNLNLESVFGPFNLTDPSKVSVLSPNGGEYLIAEDTVLLNWTPTIIPNIKIEFSGDNGSNWSSVNNSVPSSSLSYKWIVPWTLSNQCKIRISDATNATNNDLSDNYFTILRPNLIGGPYLLDKNTVALLHFDNDLKNRSNMSGNGIGSATNIENDVTLSPMLGNCYKTTSTVSIPHHANLSLSGDWTIEAWVKLNSFSTNSDMFIITKPGDSNAYESNYSLDINPWWGNVFYAFYFSETNSRIGLISQTIKLNEWYHIAMTRYTKNKIITVYIHDKNRNQLSASDLPYTPTTTYLNSKDVLIGSGIDGYVDEVRISNIVRSFTITATNFSKTKNTDLFYVYPNPSTGVVQIKLNDTQCLSAKIEMSNMSGQLVFTENKTFLEDSSLNLNYLPKGLYLLKISDNNYCQTTRIILK